MRRVLHGGLGYSRLETPAAVFLSSLIARVQSIQFGHLPTTPPLVYL